MSTERNAERPVDPSTASHDFVPPQALIDFMSSGWIGRPVAAGVHPEADRFRERREQFGSAYAGTYLIVPAGRERVRANDTTFQFRPASDFAYLVGDGEPGALLILQPDGASHRSILFVPPHNQGTAEFFTDRVYGELWVGRHRGVAESRLFYGVDECRPLQELPAYLQEIRNGKYAFRLLRGSDEEIDRDFESTGGDAAAAEHLSEMRLVKDDYELAELRKACAITKRAFEDAIRAMHSATSEREIETAFSSRARIDANDTGYGTIAAGGDHTCTLHWTKNSGALATGGLLLLDAGVECESFYTADVTRTLPISGHFSPEQQTIYDLVWEAQRAAMEGVAPGNDFLEPNRRAMRVLAEGLIELRILTTSLEEALDPDRLFHRRYTLHGISHMLGLDVHDCANARTSEYRHGKLREGMVLTIEPGLYFQPDDATVPERFRGIGVRIEDDVAVTSDGFENLSSAIPSRRDDVERWIGALWSS